ncbi:16S rRNA (guanine(1207)-N(2))-methyltransferase RsmC [Edwardsiella piscicida]|uniref:16S rRNA (guanine(1207)-N(2))-methyltransferase RsmC n=1 Tax=Edwardsiella piscicida TaxID=1263550 RepID=UPI001CEC1904|nr:16S rRNA (guanine(1207)-N(2))-methyltransferase RsmC [Edwardsiella piscicida]AOP44699.2 16S rRNA (guanine(1207)-N(2))-methyltransferase RsmC [Edwardsiella piscicida]UCQ31740.1 16S rRNA (guanine(1207)-N(2))-methyltransferase RsmC [Edwardsiella piscicida]
MSAFTPASEVVLRHGEEFEPRRVLFAGDLQDTLPAQFNAVEVRAHTTQYHHWQALHPTMGERCLFSLTITAEFAAGIDTLIYFWPKSKPEALFQLTQLLSQLPVGCDVFIVGENRAGVRSAEELASDMLTLNKIDSARRRGLYHGQLAQPPRFDLNDWWMSYDTGSLRIATLPGVFSRDGLDIGSHLLLSSLPHGLKGHVLDVGCGAGVLSAAIARMSPETRLTLSDVNAAALTASRQTLAQNAIDGEVLASNVFSDISGRFDLIISNPPFHDGVQTSLLAAQTLIRGAVSHLQLGGELRIVANAFLPYPQVLDAVFGRHEVVAQTGKFKVYSAILDRAALEHSRR